MGVDVFVYIRIPYRYMYMHVCGGLNIQVYHAFGKQSLAYGFQLLVDVHLVQMLITSEQR